MNLKPPSPTARSGRSLAVLAAAICLLTSVVALVAPSAAEASGSRTPAKATRVGVSAATSSSLTVSSAPAQYATKYRVIVSTVKSDIYYVNLIADKHTSARHYATANAPRVTVGGLHYTTAPYYYRVQTFDGSKFAYSADILSAGLLPARPTSLKVTDVGGLSLTWNSGAVTGYTVAQSTSPGMVANRRDWTLAGNTHQFTPYGIKPGQPYYFAVRALNNGTRSTYSTHAGGTTAAHEQSLRVMTYNVLMTQADGSKEPGGTVLPWSTRGPAVAALINRAHPDVLAVQEAGGWVGKNPGTRQVDSLVSYLGGAYGLAHTENNYAQMQAAHSYVRHYSYILYKRSAFQPVGNGGFWDVDSSSYPDPHWAAYQELRSVSTGAKFLFVSTHLIVGDTSTLDARRQAETTNLVSNATRLAHSLGVKVVYGGDFNSNGNTSLHPFDGPGSVMRADGITDSRLVAPKTANNYSSMNFLLRTPLPYPIDVIDYVFLPPGTSASFWALAMNLSKGKIVGTIPSDHNPVWANVIIRY